MFGTGENPLVSQVNSGGCGRCSTLPSTSLELVFSGATLCACLRGSFAMGYLSADTSAVDDFQGTITLDSSNYDGACIWRKTVNNSGITTYSNNDCTGSINAENSSWLYEIEVTSATNMRVTVYLQVTALSRAKAFETNITLSYRDCIITSASGNNEITSCPSPNTDTAAYDGSVSVTTTA